jgi:hypothetical protein
MQYYLAVRKRRRCPRVPHSADLQIPERGRHLKFDLEVHDAQNVPARYHADRLAFWSHGIM